MAEFEIDYDPVDSITVGVEGEPGERTFFVEGRQAHRTCTLLVEKAQLQELGSQLLQILEPAESGTAEAPEPITSPASSPGWRVGNIKLSLDERHARCTLLFQERGPLSEEEDDTGPDDQLGGDAVLRTARMVATIEQVRLLAERSLQVVEGGRPVCPLCHLPIDASGHVCPASNGHRPL